MAYTSEELNAAIDNIVRTSIRFEYDSLGTRKVGTSFNDLQDAAAGVFVSFPNALSSSDVVQRGLQVEWAYD